MAGRQVDCLARNMGMTSLPHFFLTHIKAFVYTALVVSDDSDVNLSVDLCARLLCYVTHNLEFEFGAKIFA